MNYVMSELLSSDGGPLVMMDSACKSAWSDFSDDPADYELACSTQDYLEKVTWKGNEIYILGDEPLATAVITHTSQKKIIILRWRWADNEEQVIRYLDEIVNFSGEYIERLDVEINSGQLAIFDAAAGCSSEPVLLFDLPKNRYRVKTYIFTVERMSLLVHRFDEEK